MQQKKYSSDLDAQDWQRLQLLVPSQRCRNWPLVEILNGIFYYLKNECLWQDLPADFPPFTVVRNHFHKWQADGTWSQVEQWILDYYGEHNGARKYKKRARSIIKLHADELREAD